MRTSLWACAVILLSSLGCTVFDSAASPSYRGTPAAICNTPGRKALLEEITNRGGLTVTKRAALNRSERLPGASPVGPTDAEAKWDNSVDASTKASMGDPLSEVVLPQDRFSVQEVENARLTFPEAQIDTPLTLDDYRAEQSPDDSAED